MNSKSFRSIRLATVASSVAAGTAATLLMGLVALAGCDQGQASPAQHAPVAEIPAGQADGKAEGKEDRKDAPAPATQGSKLRQLLRTLDIMVAANSDPAVLTDWAFSIESGERSVDDFLDALVETPGLGRDVAPPLIFGSYLSVHNYYAMPTGYNLKQTEPDADQRVVHYIREPCDASQAVAVKPWWDLGKSILVCPDTYRPEKWTVRVDEHEYRSRMPLACDSQVGSPENENQPLCGCGPNLIRCMPSVDRYLQFHASMKSELRRTTAYVVANDLPMDRLFVGNESFRDRRAEFLYRRARIGSLKIANVAAELDDLDAWPEQGKWAPRPEIVSGQHAGVLTSHQLLNWSPDRRQRQRQIYEIMWCEGRNSFGATTDKIFEISKTANLAFVHDSWQRLAHMPLCTNCHARLDYGFQFWMGYPDARASTHYVPELQAQGKGPLYSDDIDDPRGEATLTPQAFARLAVAQPEFSRCMSGKVVDYVLGDRATAEDRDAVSKAFATKRSFKEAMRVALGRYAWHWMQTAAATTPERSMAGGAQAASDKQATGGKQAGNEPVPIKGPLREHIDEYCMDCHDEVEFIDSSKTYGLRFDFGGDELPRELVVRMADHLAYRKMPEDPDAMDDATRTRMVELFIAALWQDPDAQREARSYYVDGMRPLPAHHIDVAMMAIDNNAGRESGIEWGLLERALYPDQAIMTPGYVASTALEALEACGGSGQDSSRELVLCLERTLSLSRLSRWPPP